MVPDVRNRMAYRVAYQAWSLLHASARMHRLCGSCGRPPADHALLWLL